MVYRIAGLGKVVISITYPTLSMPLYDILNAIFLVPIVPLFMSCELSVMPREIAKQRFKKEPISPGSFLPLSASPNPRSVGAGGG